MKWTKVKDMFGDCDISGIYKVKTHDLFYLDKPHYSAYFIQDNQRNWGDNVCKPPDRINSRFGTIHCFKSKRAALKACKQHAKTHVPAPHTIKRAAEILADWENES